ncbi:YhfH family protein [Bacillus sp. FJAT-49705]|uniref:YhfH family protein n=1 Tax=Cytobacillus citreus TaxID=2833586 RepID=A0ABS5NQA0_9BACI|nr:protein YhfH [Cytobacillus citreus]MBS4189593.1 YhfH family protein [Cytobacillus citreus]
MLKSSIEAIKTLPRKICQECGQNMKEHEDSYLLECDRCLSKKIE